MQLLSYRRRGMTRIAQPPSVPVLHPRQPSMRPSWAELFPPRMGITAVGWRTFRGCWRIGRAGRLPTTARWRCCGKAISLQPHGAPDPTYTILPFASGLLIQSSITRRIFRQQRQSWAQLVSEFGTVSKGCACSVILGAEGGDDWTVIGGQAPIGGGEDVALVLDPLAGHRLTHQDIIDPAVGIFFAVEMRPRDVARIVTRNWVRQVVAVAFRRARVD